MSSSPSSGKPTSLFNTAFADELVQVPPKKFRVKRGSNEETSRRPPSTTMSQSSRSASRSLSPSTIRNAVAVNPFLSPVMKGLRRLSRSHRTADDDDNDEDEEEEGETLSLTPIEPLGGPRPQRWSLQDSKVLKPPSGRWLPSEDELEQQPQEQLEQTPPLPLPQQQLATDPNNHSAQSSSSSLNSNKPPSGRATPEDGHAPTPPTPAPHASALISAEMMHSNNKSRSTKPSSWSSSTHKPPSTSSTGSGDSSLIPPRPRRPHRASDENPHSQTTNCNKSDTKPRRARSAAPQIRSSPQVSTMTNTSKSSELSQEAAPDVGVEQRRSRRRTSPAESSAMQSTDIGTTQTISNTKLLDDISAPQPLDSKTVQDDAVHRNDLHEQQPRKGQHDGPTKEKHTSRPPESLSATTTAASETAAAAAATSTTKRASSTRATPEQREVLQRLRSKSKDKASTATGTNPEPSTRSVSEQRERSARRARSRSRDKSVPTAAPVEGEEKSLRRGKKPLSQSDSLKAPPEETVTKSNGTSTTHRHSTRRHTSQKSTGNQPDPTGTREDEQHQYHSSEITDDKVEKPDSAKRLEIIMRKNLDKETLAQVRNLKEEIKQMRNQRRKLKTGAKRGASATVQQPESEDAIVPPQKQQHKQQQAHQLSPFKAKSPSVSKSRHVTMQASLLAIAQSPFHNSGGTLKSDMSSSRSTLHSSSKLVADFNNSIGAIGIEDLDVGYVKITPPAPSEETIKIEALQKQLRKTKKLIKRTTRDVWTERDEIINLQRKNWSVRKALMLHEGPPDSLTTLNMKIEKLLRQDRQLELDTDQLNEQKDALAAECARTAKKIGDFKELFDKLHKIIVPLLPLPEDTPQEIGTFQSGSDPISPLPSPSATNRKAVVVHLSQAPAMDDIEDLSMDSSDGDNNDEAEHPNAENNDNEEEASLSLSHLRATTPRA